MKIKEGKHNVLVIPDLQVPFHHKDTIPFLLAIQEYYDTDKVVCIGDLIDGHSVSNYTPDPDGWSAGDEYSKTLEYLYQMYEVFPELDCIIGNHDIRVYKKAFNAGIPKAMIKGMKDIWDAPDSWRFVNYVEIDNVRYEHGDRAGGMYAAKKLAGDNRQSTVIGHHHATAAVYYLANDNDMIFGMNVGCLCDMNMYAFNYAKQYPAQPTMGAGVVLKGVPHFVPLKINKRGRWIGRL